MSGFLGVGHKHLDPRKNRESSIRIESGEQGHLVASLWNTDLKHMEGLELDVLALVLQQCHDELQIRFVGDISGHDIEVCSVKQYLAKEFEGLALGDIVGRVH